MFRPGIHLPLIPKTVSIDERTVTQESLRSLDILLIGTSTDYPPVCGVGQCNTSGNS